MSAGGWHDRGWRDEIQRVLGAMGRPYFLVVVNNAGPGAVAFATLAPSEVPGVLRSLADDLDSRGIVIEPSEPGA